jgi:trans-AT polyketide synthase/acyltransferase/oxidoreductase domain-containing protein
MKKVVLFPGQGSQVQGMGEHLFGKYPEIMATANQVLGYDVVNLVMQNPENRLQQTKYTQPALFVVNHLHYLQFLETNHKPSYLLGHSLGEFNALLAAGLFDFETGLKLVQKRGELMYSIPGTGMAAIIGMEYEELKSILNDKFPTIDIANINSPTQIVISGVLENLEEVADFMDEEGYSYIPLKVSGAFHSRYMSEVKEEFRNAINPSDLSIISIPVISNFTAKPYNDSLADCIGNMVNQLDNPIQWLQSIELILEQDEYEFIELGPGVVLTNLLNKIKASISA